MRNRHAAGTERQGSQYAMPGRVKPQLWQQRRHQRSTRHDSNGGGSLGCFQGSGQQKWQPDAKLPSCQLLPQHLPNFGNLQDAAESAAGADDMMAKRMEMMEKRMDMMESMMQMMMDRMSTPQTSTPGTQ